MTRKTTLLASLAFACLSACGPETVDTPATLTTQATEATTQVASSPAPNPLLAEVSSANYTLDPGHASLVWKVSHNGLSNYTARFTEFSADLEFNAADPAKSRLVATINPLSVRTDHPSGPDWDTTLRTDEKFFNANVFPEITYTSSNISLTGEDTGIIMGELSLLGVTAEVPMNVTFNGVRNFAWFGERDVIGFSATATLKRSDFGMSALLPNIGDEISITLETEFIESE